MTVRTLICAAAIALSAAPLAAQSTGDPRAGRAFAEEVCADCHAVAAKPEVMAADGPRSFIEISRDPQFTETALRVFLRTPHDRMPDYLLSREQTDDIVAYFQSLREGE